MQNEMRKIPGVDKLLANAYLQKLANEYGESLIKFCIRQELNAMREEILSGGSAKFTVEIISSIDNRVRKIGSSSLKPMYNCAGIAIHTNLGRAPFSENMIAEISNILSGYSNLEFNLETGRRGQRNDHISELLRYVTKAEDAVVVNNNAAAVMLVLKNLCTGKEAIISRGELVEIGGSFRIPEVMAASGAKMVEVGATNRTRISDYENAITSETRVLLKVHQSNFHISGFTEDVKLEELVKLAEKHNLLVIYDMGSGLLRRPKTIDLRDEPDVYSALSTGVDLVTFSGDKLLGGPQAGIIIGRADLLYKIKHYPLARAVRADKTCLAGISATLTHYLKGEAIEKIPIWRMITQNIEELHERAKNWQKQIKKGSVIKGNSMVGGGSLPGESLPTYLLALNVPKSNQFMARLRSLPLPIIARIKEKQVLFDPRTVLPNQEEMFLSKLMKVLQKKHGVIGEHSNEKRS